MSAKLIQRDPGPVAIRKGLDKLIAGLNTRHPGYRWRVSSPPDWLEGAGAVGAGKVDGTGVVAPDHEHSVSDISTTGLASDEHRSDHPEKKVA
jgi:hypothetical protein